MAKKLFTSNKDVQEKTLKPYLLEPEKNISSSPGEDESDFSESDENKENTKEKERAGSKLWFSCTKFHEEQREIDCLCCQEVLL